MPEVRTKIHALVTLGREGSHVERTVYCQRRGQSVALSVCEQCPSLLRIEPDRGSEIVCSIDHARATIVRPSAEDMSALALRTVVGHVMAKRVTCVRPDTTLGEVRRAVAGERAPCAPVVTEEGLLAGMITSSELIDADPLASTRSSMGGSGLGIPEDAPLAHAIASMAQAGVLALPVLASDGSVVGSIGALDVMRFFASAWGYELPES